MSTTTVTLEPLDIAASARSLKTGFAKFKLAGVKMTSQESSVHLELPLGRLAGLQFSYAHEQCSWTMPPNRVTIWLKGFAVEQQTDSKACHVVFRRLETGAARPAQNGKSTVSNIFFERSLRAIKELQLLDESRLAEAVQAPTDFSVLLSALNAEEALAGIRAHDPLAGARLRGLEAKSKLVEAGGGSLSSAEIAKALKITRQGVDRRRKERKLIAVELGRKGFRYPTWQIGLPHLTKALDALGDRDGWEQLAFFLNPSALLEDRTPLDVLQGGKPDVAEVLRAASAYGEQGA